MTLSISYPEITDILQQKTGKEVALSFKNEDTITAIYTASIEIPVFKKIVSKDIRVDLKMLDFTDNQLVVRMDAGLAGNVVISAIQSFLVAHIPLTVYPGATDARTFLLNLRDIEQLKPVLEQMDICTICICPEDIRIEAELNMRPCL